MVERFYLYPYTILRRLGCCKIIIIVQVSGKDMLMKYSDPVGFTVDN